MYEHRRPSAPLDRFVEQLWFARGRIGYRRERIAPTGSTVAVIVLGDPIVETADDGRGVPVRTATGFLIGPHTGPVLNEPTGETHAYGVVTTPVGCRAVLGVDPATVRSTVVELPGPWRAATDARAALAGAADPAHGLDLLEAALLASLEPGVPGLDRVMTAVAELDRDPMRPVADLAAALGVSHGHLDREFRRVVGLAPAALARLLRMRRLLAQIDVRGPVPWSDLAAEHGWFDQAHLIRDFRRHTGVTPSQYVAAQLAELEVARAGEDAGFVPEVQRAPRGGARRVKGVQDVHLAPQ